MVNEPTKEKLNTTESDTTIYKPAIEPANKEKTTNRYSSSSDEVIDTSDEFVDENNPMNGIQETNAPMSSNLPNPIADLISVYNRHREERDAQPGTSRQHKSQPNPDERADQMVREAETSKIRMLDVKGKSDNQHDNDRQAQFARLADSFFHSSLVDETYNVIDSHVDENTRKKILNGEFVEFERLLPRVRSGNASGVAGVDEDCLMNMINVEGYVCWAPASSCRERGGISGFARWEQAFRVFMNIYTQKFPHRAVELVQYNHIIHTASTTFVWGNVYTYDIEFRKHMANFPQRSWAIILNQAYTMYLKDRNRFENRNFSPPARSQYKKDVCYQYNRGRCTYGSSCKFEHKCMVCNKYGHGSHNCRKADKSNDRPERKDQQPDRRDGPPGGGGGGHSGGAAPTVTVIRQDRPRDQKPINVKT